MKKRKNGTKGRMKDEEKRRRKDKEMRPATSTTLEECKILNACHITLL
ncbi:MAG: hypothetical protein KAT40_04080 [Bacteroidales bacterium]|nr:hypothetical protein [Bacteroidales bacterium]